jgi:uncharacterized membrane protein (DUF485 family)
MRSATAGGGVASAERERAGDGATGPAHHPEIDWHAAERSPEFRKLVRKRRGFVVPAMAFFLVWYFGFIVLAGYAPDFMGESIYEGFTVGYMLALSQFVVTWVLCWLYLRRADRVFDPLAEAASRKALEASGATDGAPEQREGAERRFDPARGGGAPRPAGATVSQEDER